MRRRRRVQIDTSDLETRAVWETAQRAAEEVAAWPAWKRGEEPSSDERMRDLEEAAWLREWGVGP